MIYCTKITFPFEGGKISILSSNALFLESDLISLERNEKLFQINKVPLVSDIRFDEYKNIPILLSENKDYIFKVVYDRPTEFLLYDNFQIVDVNNEKTIYSLKFNSKNYVGLLNTRFLGISDFVIEIESFKINYQEEYNNLILKITDLDTDLISRARSIFETRASVSDILDRDPNFLNSKLSFIRAKILGGELENLYNSFFRKPISRISTYVIERNPWEADNFLIEDYFNAVLDNHIKATNGKLIPSKISTTLYDDTSDTVENQFIKYVLEYIIQYLEAALSKIQSLNISNLEIELRQCLDTCNKLLINPLFSSISKLSYFPTKSNTLHSRYPYRDIFNIYILLFYEIEIVDDVIQDSLTVPLKDLPKLYEYWCFLSFVEILNSQYSVESEMLSTIISYDAQTLSYRIKIPSGGIVYSICDKKKIVLHYQKSYTGNNIIFEGRSYSHSLDPDISLELFSSDKLVAIIHFDAKYRLDNLDRFKNEDIDKMHTYKDAILASIGAFVLYPGKATESFIQEEKNMINEAQLFPSVGAFVFNIDNENITTEQNAIIKLVKDFVDVDCDLVNDGIFTSEEKQYNYKKRLID